MFSDIILGLKLSEMTRIQTITFNSDDKTLGVENILGLKKKREMAEDSTNPPYIL